MAATTTEYQILNVLGRIAVALEAQVELQRQTLEVSKEILLEMEGQRDE